MLREAQVDARHLLDAVDAALGAAEALLLPREQFQILCAMQEIADLLEQGAGNEGANLEGQKTLREARTAPPKH